MATVTDPCVWNPATESLVSQRTIGTTATQVAPIDSCRTVISFSAIGMFGAMGPVVFSPLPKVNDQRVVALANRGEFIELKSEYYGALVGGAWYAMSISGSIPVTIITARLARPRMLQWEQQSSLQAVLSQLNKCVSVLSSCYENLASQRNVSLLDRQSASSCQQARQESRFSPVSPIRGPYE